MTSKKEITLKEAQNKGKLKEFIKQHSDQSGDLELFDKTLNSMAGKSQAVPQASSQEHDEN